MFLTKGRNSSGGKRKSEGNWGEGGGRRRQRKGKEVGGTGACRNRWKSIVKMGVQERRGEMSFLLKDEEGGGRRGKRTIAVNCIGIKGL